ncbi:MAG: PQQ-binding-like beta-propeller repeat protein, partial [Thermoplasmata archaeon]|nr:PQQ-binding-like beta-propeller repeat protein [Thermoplasmata archaeon]
MSGLPDLPAARLGSRRGAACVAAVLLLVGIPIGAFALGESPGAAIPTPGLAPPSAHSLGGVYASLPGSAPWPVRAAGVNLVAATSTNDWKQFHGNPRLTGYDPSSSLSATNAAQLGVAWATNLYGAALDSPVVAYDSLLRETLAYVGTESGNVLAVNVANGQTVWGTWLGSPVRSTPAVSNGAVFVGTFRNPALIKLNATTGA